MVWTQIKITLIITAYDLFCDTHLVLTKGQEISEENYGVFYPQFL